MDTLLTGKKKAKTKQNNQRRDLVAYSEDMNIISGPCTWSKTLPPHKEFPHFVY